MKWILLILILTISLDDSFDEEDPNNIIPIRILAWHTKFEKSK